MRSRTAHPASILASTLLVGTAMADITGAYVVSYSVTAEDFGGTAVTVDVQDLYLASDDASDVVVNVYNLQLTAAGEVPYHQSATGTGWAPTNLGGIFDTPALRTADSFVTIGGFAQDTLRPEQSPGAGDGIAVDPDFGGNSIDTPTWNAGWYNSSPPSLAGRIGNVAGPNGGFALGLLIGRFAYEGDFTLEGSTLWTTWNQGIGTEPVQAGFTVTPAPGAIALLGLAGLAGRRRRAGA